MSDLSADIKGLLSPAAKPPASAGTPRRWWGDGPDDEGYYTRQMYGHGVQPHKPTTPYRPQTTYGSAGYQNSYAPMRVAVVHADERDDRYTIPYEGRAWFAIASTVWPTVDNVMRVPVEHCQFTYADPPFNACVFTAANDYLQARWGRKMDHSDQRWLALHPYATDGGVPQEYTATCVHQLVAPYGMVVSRVRLRRGSLVLGDSVMAWLNSLGCNPFAMADRSTTNAEAAAKMGITPAEADALWRVEFHDDPLPGSIIGERGWSNQASSSTTGSVVTGNFGGHARYLAPRGRAGDWFISVQLAPDDRVEYLVPPPDPAYEPRKGNPTLLYGSVTGLDGQPIAVKDGTSWRRVGDAPAAAAGTASLPTLPDVPKKPAASHGHLVTCGLCAEDVSTAGVLREADVCYECAEALWDGMVCPHCKVSLRRQIPYPLTYSITDQGLVEDYEYSCNACRETIVFQSLDATPEPTEHDFMLEHYHELVFNLEPLTDDKIDQIVQDEQDQLEFPPTDPA
jgi:hypothetical protein